MKSLLSILFLVIIIISSCHNNINAPVQTCTNYWQESPTEHPKADSLQAILDDFVRKGFPGLVLAVNTPDGVWVGAAGKAKLETQEPMQPCHLFHSASVAKTYHVTAALKLAEAGKLDIHKTINHYLPESVCANLPNRNIATIKDLMNHTSGIPDFIEQIDHITDYYNNLHRTFTTKQYLNYVCGKKANFQPATKIEYSNTNTVLLALIMDKLEGNHADVLTKEIFEPLNLTKTFYKNEKGYPAPKGVVNTYIDMRGNGKLINSTEIERNFAKMNIGHDAMVASAYDYMSFMHALFNEKIINRTSLDTMMNMFVIPNRSNIQIGFGLGLEMIYSEEYKIMRAGHNGASLGAANNVFHYVEPNITIAVCSNFGDFMPNPLGKLFYHWNIGTEGRLLGEIERLLLEK